MLTWVFHVNWSPEANNHKSLYRRVIKSLAPFICSLWITMTFNIMLILIRAQTVILVNSVCIGSNLLTFSSAKNVTTLNDAVDTVVLSRRKDFISKHIIHLLLVNVCDIVIRIFVICVPDFHVGIVLK